MTKTENTPKTNANPGEIQATHVNVSDGGVKQIIAQEVNFRDGGIQYVEAGSLKFENGGIGIARAEGIQFSNGGIGILFANRAELGENAQASLLLAREARGSIKTALLLTGKVEGEVQTALDTPRALLFGAAVGAVIGLFLVLGQLLAKRNS